MSDKDTSELGCWQHLLDPVATILYGVLFAVVYLALLLIKLPAALFRRSRGIQSVTGLDVGSTAPLIAAILLGLLTITVWIVMFITEPVTRPGTIIILVVGDICRAPAQESEGTRARPCRARPGTPHTPAGCQAVHDGPGTP